MNLTDFFTHTQNTIYFNHASSGPLPLPTRDKMKSLIDELDCGDKPWDFWLDELRAFRSEASQLLRVNPREIACVANTSSGLLIALYSILWKDGDNLVMMGDCFPANIVPWERNLPGVEKRKIFVKGDGPLEERILSAIDDHTRAVAIDWVDFLTGYRIDLARIGKACKDRGVFLVVDGIQGCGMLELNLSEVHVDFFTSASSKWLLGPVGSGLLYVNSRTIPRLEPAFAGWMSLDWKQFNRFDPLPSLKADAGRFESGSYAGILMVGFTQNLRILNSIGITEIERRVMALREMLYNGLQEMGASIVSPPMGEHTSGILTFRFTGRDNEALYDLLDANKVKASLREDSIRLSPHFYNTEEESGKVLGLIKGFLSS
ncbi:aminotransferase class V-fold PLP-dependent enzyme [candidate division WOR-3 bacterium]|nr:aminotransferase class V-fold PLP-dependent enzyme [candidate division WOR-3 bacterium]